MDNMSSGGQGRHVGPVASQTNMGLMETGQTCRPSWFFAPSLVALNSVVDGYFFAVLEGKTYFWNLEFPPQFRLQRHQQPHPQQGNALWFSSSNMASVVIDLMQLPHMETSSQFSSWSSLNVVWLHKSFVFVSFTWSYGGVPPPCPSWTPMFSRRRLLSRGGGVTVYLFIIIHLCTYLFIALVII